MDRQLAVEAELRKTITENEQLASLLRQEKHAIELQLTTGTTAQLQDTHQI